MGAEDITASYMSASNHTVQGNSTAPADLPLVLGLSVGLPLSLLVVIALVLGLLWVCRTFSGSFQPPAHNSTNPNTMPNPNPPKTVNDCSYPSACTADPVYENYQAGGGSEPPAPDYRCPRNDYQQSPRRSDPDQGDTAIYANVPSTFPSRT